MKTLRFEQAFRYPFSRWQRLFTILWALVPIVGWFAVFGYYVKLVQEWVDGGFDGLPRFRFIENLKRGFLICLKMLPLLAVAEALPFVMAYIGHEVGVLLYLIVGTFVFPLLFVNLFVKESVRASFDFSVITSVGGNVGDYVIAVLKTVILTVVFASLIVVVVGIPAVVFTQNIFVADFYRRHVT